MPAVVLMCLVNKHSCFWHVNLLGKLHVSDLLLFSIWGKIVMLYEIFKKTFVYSSHMFIPEDQSLECFASYVWFLGWGGCSLFMTSILESWWGTECAVTPVLPSRGLQRYSGLTEGLWLCSCLYPFPCGF